MVYYLKKTPVQDLRGQDTDQRSLVMHVQCTM